MKKKKGFTLVELLAVIVILAVILVIAVPQIMSVIESARKGSIESTAKLIAEGAEREYTNRKILGKDTNIECSEVANLNDKDYGSCSISFDNSGKAIVKVTGKGKFEGYTCKGNSTNMECIKGEPIPTDASYFTYEENEKGERVKVLVKDKDKCVAALQKDWSETDANTLCSGNALEGLNLNGIVQQGYILSKDYETAGLNVDWITINNVKIKNKDKCISYISSASLHNTYKENADILCAGGKVTDGNTIRTLVINDFILFNDYETAGLEVDYIKVGNIAVKDKEKCVNYQITSFESTEEEADTICSGNALDDGWTIKDDVLGGHIPSGDYETAGLEVISKPYSYVQEITITGYNSGFNVEITDQEKCKAYVKENNITNDSLTEMLCAGESYTKIDRYVSNNSIPKSDYKIAGLEVTYKNGGGPDVVIPSMIDGKKVIRIEGKGSFAEKGITSLVIPNTVTSIGNNAFTNNQLIEVIIPNSVIDIENDAFRGNQITSLTLSNGVKTIGAFAFEYNKLTEVTIPSSVTNINESAFAYNKLTLINFPTTPLSLTCDSFHDNPITKDDTYTYPDNVTVVECIPS